jgi:uncharacterized protein (DUF427 family)
MAKTVEGRASGYSANPHYRIRFEPSPRRVRVGFNGAFVADSTRAHLLFETWHVPVYYFPRADVRIDLLVPSGEESFCPFKGKASYWTILVDGRRAENAVWGYPEPFEEVKEIAEFLAFYWDRVDAWYEEDDEVFVHARDPYKRVDVLNSSREVQVILGGEIVAQSRRARFLFETGLPTRYYFPPEDVRGELLVPSDRVSACPYKGRARYYSIRLGGRLWEDVVWTYPEPIPECPKIKGFLAFFHERVDEIRIAGVPLPRPLTPWSPDWKEKRETVPDPVGPRAAV